MEQDEQPLWESGKDIPSNIDPYRFWFAKEFERAGVEQFIVPYLVTANDTGELRNRSRN